ncbi:rhodanese-like domain-containing protein [Caballeronia sp. SEWSISQ10-4 2]|uniref:rhodanese-like domain-containing protein n=1 Tax=Caballeronia sp. SEWSISQ10-4 2 TaxID=2937438 RepID=UPI002655FCE1|nr:rhodanese-like domain-containing protein [Caballeronia sp. SEWSISQ10-4 2]MDN7182864.1 rhodanese-like domain-containing protein [Caballeronia sp. SEWSISQ10-4 2]
MSIREIHRSTLQTWLTQTGLSGGQELALLDLRTETDFGNGAPLFATNLPLPRLEASVRDVVPRQSVRLVLVDGGDGTAASGAQILERLGYSNLHILAGGVAAWTVDGGFGLPTFDIPGNVFAGSIRELRATPSLDAAELQALRDEGHDVIVIDTRTPREFAESHVPGAVNVPGEEILHRFLDNVPNPDTLVVVSCAGLPRAIIGAQTLVDAQVPNGVALLEDGTVGWTRASFELESGADRSHTRASASSAAYGAERVGQLAARAGISIVERDRVDAWLAEGDSRTTYLLDVRSEQEYEAGHLAGSISAPGGQLLGVTYRTLATRGARVVLIDDDGTRALTTAYWLQHRGWDVHVFSGALPGFAAARHEQGVGDSRPSSQLYDTRH